MNRLLVIVVVVLLFAPAGQAASVTLLHFSDYHSHALPFHTAEGERGGIARAIAYLKNESGKGALVFSGGDMLNKGTPAWSDRYGCVEWPWLDGVLDAMAFGNHEADYGRDSFEHCRNRAGFPVLAANVDGMPGYRLFVRNGVRIGVFAIAGADFEKLGTWKNLEGGEGGARSPLTFGDPVQAARRTVETLRSRERADVVVMIGHQHAEADVELARQVPGIDLIFGTHSHRRQELTRIEGTSTWTISSFQYLTYVSRVEIEVERGRVTALRGELVPIDARIAPDPEVEKRVAALQSALVTDPVYRELFAPVAELREPLDAGALAVLTLEAMREAASADVAVSTVSSFRASLPSGTIDLETLRTALPYDNEIVVCTAPGDQLLRLVEASRERRGSDSELRMLGLPAAVDPARQYRVAATDYVANVAYRGVLDCDVERTGLRVLDQLRRRLARPMAQSQPFSRAIRAASTRLPAPSLLIASER